MLSSILSLLPLASVAVAASTSTPSFSAALPTSSQTTCNGKTYTYNELAGYGFIPSRFRDKYGDTMGGFGSAIAIDQASWTKTGVNTYTGTLWAIPDRGWNTVGTLNFQNRIHKIGISLTIQPNATASTPSTPNLKLTYEDSILFTDPAHHPTTGIDANVDGPYLHYSGFSEAPSANFTGDGFGDAGPGGYGITVDSEGLVLGANGTFWISDEYGPYIYQLSPEGTIIQIIRPPDAYIPLRNGSESFSADSPPIYDLDEIIDPADTTSGRDNNQGFEGLTASPDGTKLYALLQSAMDQEGGLSSKTEEHTRLLVYDISVSGQATYDSEYVVTLPTRGSGSSKIAAQSEMHYISDTQFLVLARDSGEGRGQGTLNTTENTNSTYRHIDVFDLSNATNIKGSVYDCTNCSIASSGGVLKSGIQAALYCPWLDYNNNTELARFHLHNGGYQDWGLLNEKWESIATVPVNPGVNDGQFFIFTMSDNDFITQDGYMNFGRYQYVDSSGFDLDNQALVFRVQLPISASSSTAPPTSSGTATQTASGTATSTASGTSGTTSGSVSATSSGAASQTVTDTVTVTAASQTVTQTVTETAASQTVTQTVTETAASQTVTVTETVGSGSGSQTVTKTVSQVIPQKQTTTVTTTVAPQTVIMTRTFTQTASVCPA